MVQSRAAGGQQYLTVCHSMAFFHPITWKLPEQQWGAVRWGTLFGVHAHITIS